MQAIPTTHCCFCGKEITEKHNDWIGKSRLQRYDNVEWNGLKCFIFGSTNSRLYLKDIDGNKVTPNPHVNKKTVIFIHRKINNMLINLIQKK